MGPKAKPLHQPQPQATATITMAATVPPQFYSTPAGAVPPEQHIHIEAGADESTQYSLAAFLGENLNQWSIIFMVEILMCTAIVVPGPISFRRRFMNQLAKLWNEYPHFRLRHHQRPGSRRLRLHPQQGRLPGLLQG